MAVTDSSIAHARELLSEFGEVQVRKMFGGAGLYRDGLMFAILIGDELFLKVDDANRGSFEAAGAEPFIFSTRDGRRTPMSYWRLPATAADDPGEVLRWARLGFEAALRAKQPKRKGAATRHDLGPGPWEP